jgi:hypothetical protein
MRNLTSEEQAALMDDICPFCQGPLRHWPSLWSLVDHADCRRCGAGFNLPPYDLTMTAQLTREPQRA